MRILLATEGESDEAVARCLIARQIVGVAEVVPKKFPARGFAVVKRAISTLVRAAHYSHFDALIVHFDLNGTLPQSWKSLAESSRWRGINEEAHQTLARLPSLTGRQQLKIVLMAPCQSTDAWVGWGAHGGRGDPAWWERRERNLLKSELYGGPPQIGVLRKVHDMLPSLVARMNTTSQWPATLRLFVDALNSTLPPAP